MRIIFIAILCSLLVLGACSSSDNTIPSTLYQNAEVGMTFEYPQGWAVQETDTTVIVSPQR